MTEELVAEGKNVEPNRPVMDEGLFESLLPFFQHLLNSFDWMAPCTAGETSVADNFQSLSA